MQLDRLAHVYLLRWAQELGAADLLHRACEEAGLEGERCRGRPVGPGPEVHLWRFVRGSSGWGTSGG